MYCSTQDILEDLDRKIAQVSKNKICKTKYELKEIWNKTWKQLEFKENQTFYAGFDLLNSSYTNIPC